ncbi:NAD(P)-binding protein [Clostridiaceae bacterium M8S5]|nr:NAD(P)-binding protein [Clostridiaceae bacterium M8S5]
MKICIVGTNIAGLSCALECERLGFEPVIYEKKFVVGGNMESPLFCTRKEVNYIKDKYDIELAPLNKLNSITTLGCDKEKTSKGRYGYIYKQGIGTNSIENQIFKKLKCKINYGKHLDVSQSKKDFDYVVNAGDTNIFPLENNIYEPFANTSIRISDVVGKFNKNSLIIWYDKAVFSNCYGYLIPYSNKHATIFLIVNSKSKLEFEFIWQRFIRKINNNFQIILSSDVFLRLGKVSSPRIDNVLLVGKTVGLYESFVGNGLKRTVESGILAARAMIENKNYNTLMRNIIKCSGIIPMPKVVGNHDFRY